MDRKITIDRTKPLIGKGGFASVFHGTLNATPVAVKRIEHHKRCNDKEERALKMLNHPNIVQLYSIDDNEDFRFYAFELCTGSLDQVFLHEDDPQKYRGPPLPRHINVLLQLAEGLAYIHSKGLVHRDIKPANVLISISNTEPAVAILKWADFGLTKETDECGTYEMSGQRGTLYWMAPEILAYFNRKGPSGPNNFTYLTDVFSAGCLFFSVVTCGTHPFGDSILTDVPPNILSNNPVNFLNNSILPNSYFCHDCIKNMLDSNSVARWSMSKVVDYLQEKKKMELHDLCLLLEPTDGQVHQLAQLLEDKECPDLNEPIPIASFHKPLTPLELLCGPNYNLKLKQCIQLLLESERKKHKRNNHPLRGTTALAFICGAYTRDGIKEIIQLLLDHTTIDLKIEDYKNHIFCDLLFNIRLRQRLDELEDVIGMLKNYGFVIYTKEMNHRQNALHHLLYHQLPSPLKNGGNIVEIGQLLIDNGIDVNSTNDDGDTTLHLLFHFRDIKDELEIIRMLIERGIDINKKNKYGENALNCFLGRYNGERKVEIANLLIQSKTDVNSTDFYGRNAIYYLLLRSRINEESTIEILEMLIERGIDVNALDKDGRNGLFYLSFYFHVKTSSEEANNIRIMIAKMLINRGINVSLCDKYGRTALHYFLSRCNHNDANNLEMIELLK